jgi:prepilin-type N-terminal cleavage/methylation domain-containing protein
MRRSGGFTMIEMMMVVAVLGILTVVAVVGYSKIFKKAHASEIPQMFGELKTREETFKAESGFYLPVCKDPAQSATPVSDCSEANDGYWPRFVAGSHDPMDASGAMPQRWQQLKVNIGRGSLYCQYQVIAGAAGDNASMGTHGVQVFTATAPIRGWFYVMGQCDWDADSSVNAEFWQRDDLSIIGSVNELR